MGERKPRTPTGKRITRILFDPHWEVSSDGERRIVPDDILAIEAEAREQVLNVDTLAKALHTAGLWPNYPNWADPARKYAIAILAALKEVRRG